MRVLLVGGGGREHALAASLARSPSLEALYAAPGNPGIAALGECVDIQADDAVALLDFAEGNEIDLTVVGPEQPLVDGIVDTFRAAGRRIFGPTRAAARLEGSKSFMKELCRRHRIPSGSYRTFSDAAAAHQHLENVTHFPVVVKADGLAAGKGVIIARNRDEADAAVDRMMVDRAFGGAGATVVIEEFLEGVEASVIAIVDGRTIAVLDTAKDHKAAQDYDKGPNTGGMGAVSPSRRVTPELLESIESHVLVPTVHALARDAGGFHGFLYAGLMLTPAGPKVLEFNVRFGDPEAQAILPRLRSDFVQLLALAADRRLHEAAPLEWDPRPSCCVVMASDGYPGSYRTGHVIHGLEAATADEDVTVFHAGTSSRGGRVVTAGGRVLGVTALGHDLRDACARAYRAVEKVRFQGAYYRTDIGRSEYEGGP